MLPELLVGGDVALVVGHLVRHRQRLGAWLRDALEHRSRDSSWERSPHRHLRVALVRALQRENQFLHVDAPLARALDAAFRRLLRDLARALASPTPAPALRATLRDALEAHEARVSSLLGDRVGRSVVSAEYDPTLQLAVLGLDLPTLADPVLDVGCGREARLVTALRHAGHDAHGIDRDSPGAGALEADWLEYEYGTSRWGTVLSHLAFSLHFLHHHLARGDTALVYAKAYMTILRSLRPGGVFAYAPALPFIEQILPGDTYRVRRIPLARALRTPAVRAAEEASGVALGNAAHVARLR